MSDSDSEESTQRQQEDKRIRQLYQALLQRRPINYWNILDFPYLAEIVRHDSSYLRRILSFIFVDQPALSHYLTVIACRETCKCEQLPVGFERTLWQMYKHEAYISSVWSPDPAFTTQLGIAADVLPPLNFDQFLSKINGVSDSEEEEDDNGNGLDA